MEVKVISRSKNELRLEVIGEDHTFCNLLQNVLLDDKNVELAGYDQPHPLIRASVIYLKTRRDISPEKTLLNALDSMQELNKEFDAKFSEAVGPS